MFPLTFDPQDPTVRSFLTDFIGLPEDVIADGVLNAWEVIDNDVSQGALWAAAREDMFISPADAQNVLDLVRTHGKSVIHSLFKDKKCPGRSISAPQIIMGNLQGLNEENRFRGAVFPEECCSFEQMEPYGPLNLRGLHFSEQMAPKSIAAFGRAVVRMVRLNGEEKKCDASGVIGSASGVIVSNEGHLLTARHVLYHNREFRRPHWHWKRFRGYWEGSH